MACNSWKSKSAALGMVISTARLLQTLQCFPSMVSFVRHCLHTSMRYVYSYNMKTFTVGTFSIRMETVTTYSYENIYSSTRFERDGYVFVHNNSD